MKTACVVCGSLIQMPVPAFIILTDSSGKEVHHAPKHRNCTYWGQKGDVTVSLKNYINGTNPWIERLIHLETILGINGEEPDSEKEKVSRKMYLIWQSRHASRGSKKGIKEARDKTDQIVEYRTIKKFH